MKNLEAALSNLTSHGRLAESFCGSAYVIPVRLAEQIVKSAATPDWKYPEKGEFPLEKQNVIVVLRKNLQTGSRIFCSEFSNDFKNSYIAWCELPIYEQK